LVFSVPLQEILWVILDSRDAVSDVVIIHTFSLFKTLLIYAFHGRNHPYLSVISLFW